jgi:hypothetical protein
MLSHAPLFNVIVKLKFALTINGSQLVLTQYVLMSGNIEESLHIKPNLYLELNEFKECGKLKSKESHKYVG